MNTQLAITRAMQGFLFAACVCLYATAANEPCTIKMAITPSSGNADHAASTPGNQVQFSLSSSVEGNCPMIPDSHGAWTTSDSENTTISNDPADEGLAVCLHATPNPVTISNSSRVRGHKFPAATLVCN